MRSSVSAQSAASLIVATPRRAFAYVRVSVDEEAGNNASITAQTAAIRDYAFRHGIEVCEIFEEPDVSGRKEQRKQFDRMIALATSDERPVEVIIVNSLSRFARRLLTQLVAEHKLAQANVELISVIEGTANDPNSKLMRSFMGLMNEKYAMDASYFTRRDRRGNALAGYWNGGPVPYGYKSVCGRIDGRKERRKLAIIEEEAAIVRLIFELALSGLDGQPMGTRSIAKHLNEQGYKLRGKPFRHSNVDGILTREHYGGIYYDRTSPQVDQVATANDAIAVTCPMIIEGEIVAAVAARRARAAPRVTAPRIINSPVLLTGIAHCGMPGCSAGITIRSGKSGAYRYYTCNSRSENADSCRCPPIRESELDKLILDGLLHRVLEPARLRTLLAGVLELSDGAQEKRRTDLARIRRERVQAENGLRLLLDLVMQEKIKSSDPVFGERLAETRGSIDTLREMERNLAAQLNGGPARITEESVNRFGQILREQLLGDQPAMRKAYTRLLVSRVTVNDNAVVIEAEKRSRAKCPVLTGSGARRSPGRTRLFRFSACFPALQGKLQEPCRQTGIWNADSMWPMPENPGNQPFVSLEPSAPVI